MKLLYVSGHHAKLEKDQIDVFLALGHEVFSTGHYKDFQNPSKESFQGALETETNSKLLFEFNALNPNFKIHNHISLSKEFVDNFDLVLVENCCPLPNQINLIWEQIKHKPVMYRSYAQQQDIVEITLSQLTKQRNITFVRVAESEKNIRGFAGIDFIIEGFLDHEKFKDWKGFGGEILTFNNFFDKRTWHSNTNVYRQVINSLHPHPFSLYGQYNENVSICKGVLPVAEQVKKYQECGVYFSLGSKPAALTYSFQEGLMTGCPLVTWGRKLGGSSPNLYSVPDIVENGIEAFLAESAEEASYYVKLLLTNEKLAKAMGSAAREKALSLWTKDIIKEKWNKAFTFALGR